MPPKSPETEVPVQEEISPTFETAPEEIFTPAVVQSAPALPLCADAQPAFVTDFELRQPLETPEPAARTPFRDPIFGACLLRVTDRNADLAADDSSPGLKNEYSRVQSFNADESRILVMGLEATWYLYDALSLQPISQIPLGAEPRWDAVDPNLIYYNDGTRLMSYNTRSQQTSLVREFADDFPGQNLAAVWTRYEGSPSADGRYWGLMAENQDWLTIGFVVYDQVADQVIAKRSVTAAEIDSVTISPSGNYFLAYYDEYCEDGLLGNASHPCGLMVYDRSLTETRGLLRIIGHSDLVLDAQGRDVLVYQDIDTDNISMLDLASGTITPLWPIDFSQVTIGLHMSGTAFNRPGWALISTHTGELTNHTWMDNQVFVIELKPGGRVVRLAHTHSRVDENQEHDYWSEPQASANHDLTRILFTSNWGRAGTDKVEMYMIVLPQDWPEHLD